MCHAFRIVESGAKWRTERKKPEEGRAKEGNIRPLPTLTRAPFPRCLFSRSLLFLPSPLFKSLEQALVKTHGRPKRTVFTLVISRIG